MTRSSDRPVTHCQAGCQEWVHLSSLWRRYAAVKVISIFIWNLDMRWRWSVSSSGYVGKVNPCLHQVKEIQIFIIAINSHFYLKVFGHHWSAFVFCIIAVWRICIIVYLQILQHCPVEMCMVFVSLPFQVCGLFHCPYLPLRFCSLEVFLLFSIVILFCQKNPDLQYRVLASCVFLFREYFHGLIIWGYTYVIYKFIIII